VFDLLPLNQSACVTYRPRFIQSIYTVTHAHEHEYFIVGGGKISE